MTKLRALGWAGAAALAALAQPVLADVKAGVDAWSRGDYAQAVREWQGPAAAGDADALFNMGQAIASGAGFRPTRGRPKAIMRRPRPRATSRPPTLTG